MGRNIPNRIRRKNGGSENRLPRRLGLMRWWKLVAGIIEIVGGPSWIYLALTRDFGGLWKIVEHAILPGIVLVFGIVMTVNGLRLLYEVRDDP